MIYVVLGVGEVEAAIHTPADRWPGRCYGVAKAMIFTGLLDGEAVYGHWRGDVHYASMFAAAYGRLGFCNHGWIRLPDGAGIVDPTRWVFEHRPPYIYAGAADPDGAEYDEGGNRLRAEFGLDCPRYDPGDSSIDLLRILSREPALHVARLLGTTGLVSTMQAAWLASLPLPEFSGHAPAVFAALVELRLGSLIPADNRLAVLGP